MTPPEYGKGAMVWQLRRWKQGKVNEQVAQALDLGLKWLSIKALDWYNETWDQAPHPNSELIPEAVRAFVAAGIRVIAWAWPRGRSRYAPFAVTIGKEIAATVARIRSLAELGAELVWQVDGEFDWKRNYIRAKGSVGFDMSQLASEYMQGIKSGVPNLEIHLCSYRFPSLHVDFPFRQFLSLSSVHAPQVYFEWNRNPQAGALDLVRSVGELYALKPIPLLPIGPAYQISREVASGAKEVWSPTKVQLLEFFKTAADMSRVAQRCLGVGVWCIDGATPEHLEALGEFQWDVPPIPALPIPGWAARIDEWARSEGYRGPTPEVPA